MQDAFNRSNKLSDGKTFVPLKPNAHKVFSVKQEDHLSTYAIKIAKMFYGLPINDFRRLAYDYAVACKSTTIPEAWKQKQSATRNWYYSYMERHRELSLKAPEGMSIARALAFNKTSIDAFFAVYTEAMEKYHFAPDRIYNMDGSSLCTVMKPVKVLCARGEPAASQISRERGSTMTFVGIINAAGHYIPPVFIIPRKRWNEAFMRGTIDGSKGILHHNGWMNGDCFLETLQHIHAKTFASPDNKIVLIMDNAECHMNIHAIEYAINNGIVIVTLPPHTTDKLQPLDVSVFGPFKTYLRGLINDYSLMNPQMHITDHMLPEFASKAWIKACTPSNVLSGFAATGTWPINRNIFPDEAFIPSLVSERPAPAPPQEPSHEAEDMVDEGVHSQTPSSSVSFKASSLLQLTPEEPPMPIVLSTPEEATTSTPARHLPETPHLTSPVSTTSESFTATTLSPEVVRPYPKAASRPAGKGRKKIRACILTENEEAISTMREKEEKKRKKAEKEQQKGRKKRTKKTKDNRASTDEEETDADDPMVLNDSSEYSGEEEERDVEMPHPFQDKVPAVDDFVLVELELEEGRNVGSKVHYVGKVLSLEDDCQYNISFLRMSSKQGLKDTFYFPVNEDESKVSGDKFFGVLEEPQKGQTQRLCRIVHFKTPLTAYNMR